MSEQGLAATGPRKPGRAFLAAAWVGAILFVLIGVFSLFAVVVSREDGIHRIHDLASFIDFGVLAGVGFAAQLRPSWRSPALAQLVLAVALVLAALYGIPLVASGQWLGLLILGVLILVPAAVVARLHPERELVWRTARPSLPLLAIAIVGGLAATPYAASELGTQLTAPAGEAHAVEMHYAGMSVLVATLALGAAVAALRAPGWRLAGRLVAASAVIFGAVSLAIPEGTSSLGIMGSAAAVVFGVVFWFVLEREAAGRLGRA